MSKTQPMISYEDAKEIARRELSEYAPWSDLRETPRQIAARVWASENRETSIERIATDARRYADFYEVGKLLVAYCLESNVALSPALRAFAIYYLRGGAKPSHYEFKRFEDSIRNAFICWAISDLVDAGLKATRNKASDTYSACDVVADVVNDLLGENLGYGGIRTIWKRKAY